MLEDWPITPLQECRAFTTVGNWRGPFGPIQVDGKTFGLKVHEFRKFMELPQRVSTPFEIAMNIHPADQKDRLMLEQGGWQIVDPKVIVRDPQAFRAYVQESGAEFSAVQGIYAATLSGWFSDRSVRYLASGKPVLVQDTGFGTHIPTGEGVLSFRTLEEAATSAQDIVQNYEHHCRAARRIAESYFDSDKVLTKLLHDTGIST